MIDALIINKVEKNCKNLVDVFKVFSNQVQYCCINHTNTKFSCNFETSACTRVFCRQKNSSGHKRRIFVDKMGEFSWTLQVNSRGHSKIKTINKQKNLLCIWILHIIHCKVPERLKSWLFKKTWRIGSKNFCFLKKPYLKE